MNFRKIIGFIVFAVFFISVGMFIKSAPELSINSASTVELEKKVREHLKKQVGSYGIYYEDLKTGESFSINGKQTFTAASANKVPIAAAAYYLASRGELSLDDKITIQEKDIQDYGTGSLRYAKPGGSYSIRNLIKLALQESDNTAAYVLGVRIGTDKIQKIINAWGLTQTDMENNKTSAYDMSLLFKKIYKGGVADDSQTTELTEFLTKSQFEERLPYYLPKTAIVYHKTGDGEGFVHDVGIIETENRTYYLGVLTSDIGNNEKQTKNSIAEISKIIYK